MPPEMPSGPDFGAILALNNFRSGKSVPILGILPGGGVDVDYGVSLSLKTGAFKGDTPLPPLVSSQGRMGFFASLADKMQKAIMSVPDEVSKNIASKVRFEAPVVAGTTVASNLPAESGEGRSMA